VIEDRYGMSRTSSLVFAFLALLMAGAVFGQQAERPPEKPIQLEASADFEGATAVASLKWRDMSDDELGFEVLRSDNGKDYRVVGMVGANTERYKDKVGKYITGAFTYKVRAFNEVGRSEESNQVSVWF
jgi:hypothetical protein